MSFTRLFARHPTSDLSAFIDGVLPDEQHAQVARHLTSCDACALELDSLRLVSDALRDLPEASAPRSFTLSPNMAAAGERPAPASAAGARSLHTLRLAGAAIAVVLAIVLVIDAGSGGDTATDEVTDASVEFDMSLAGGESAADGEGPAYGAPAPGALDSAEELAPVAPAPGATTTPDLSQNFNDYSGRSWGGDGESEATISPSADDEDGIDTLRVLEITLAIALTGIIVAAIALTMNRARRTE
jgi:hypothetical protein